MSGRSKCTAGGDEGSTKRSEETGSHASHKRIADIQSHILSRSHSHLELRVHMIRSLQVQYHTQKIKCYSITHALKMSVQSGSCRSTLTAMQRF